MSGVDWGKVKQILCDVAKTLEQVCASLPAGLPKTVICGVAGVLQLLCDSLPDSQA